MRPKKWEIRLIMIKCGRRPGRGIMTLRTVMVKIFCHMIRIINVNKVLFMTGVAIRRGTGIAAGMTINTLKC